VKATRGPRHDYLAIFLEYKDNGTVVADMAYYIKKMVEEFPDKLRNGVLCPWTERLFKVDEKSVKLSEEKAKTLYTFVMKGMFVCKHARPDIQPAIAFYITDLIQRKECELKYCPTKEMVADYHTKPHMGAQFIKFRDKIMNFHPTIP